VLATARSQTSTGDDLEDAFYECQASPATLLRRELHPGKQLRRGVVAAIATSSSSATTASRLLPLRSLATRRSYRESAVPVTLLQSQQGTEGAKLRTPRRIGAVLAKNRFDRTSVGARGRTDGRDCAAAPHHHDCLAVTLDRVEQLGKAARSVCGAQTSHQITYQILAGPVSNLVRGQGVSRGTVGALGN